MKVSRFVLAFLMLMAVPGSLSADGDHGHPSIELRLQALEKKLSQGVPVNADQLRKILSEILAEQGSGTPPVDPQPAPAPAPTPAPAPGPVAIPKPAPLPASPPQVAGRTLDECKALLAAKGGWCEMRVSDKHPGISSVFPNMAFANPLHGVIGPKAILGAWAGAAYDPEQQKFYISNGGHRDYGGNEWYSFDPRTGTWERLNDPSPLTHTYFSSNRYRWTADTRTVPSSAHTYDGVVWDRTTKTIYYLSMAQYSGGATIIANPTEAHKTPVEKGGLLLGGKAAFQYQFNPSKTETRDGLAPLSWRRVGSNREIVYGKTVQWPDGEIWMGGNGRVLRARFKEDRTLAEPLAAVAKHGNAGDGTMEYDPTRNLVWIITRKALWSYKQDGTPGPAFRNVPSNAGKSLAIDEQGTLYSWSGTDRVYSFNPDRDSGWKLEAGGPVKGRAGRTFSKWRYIGDGYFTGISTYETGWWVFKSTGNILELSNVDPQKFIDSAAEGSTVSIPPGVYVHGIRIDKSLTVNLKGVKLWGLTDRKAIVNIECNNCDVTVNDFSGNGRESSATRSNQAGIKMTGSGWALTVNRAHITRTAMGILTDNRGGNLVVNDSLIEYIGDRNVRSALTHALYAGAINSLTVNNTTIMAPQRLGHLLKSRALRTTVTNSRLYQLDSRSSRLMDISCGGVITVTDNRFQQGSNSDNSEMMGLALEPHDCGIDKEKVTTALTFKNNLLVSDRDRSRDEPQRNSQGVVFHWRGKASAPPVIEGNIFVTHPGMRNPILWMGSQGPPTDPAIDSRNTRFTGRSAAGLKPAENGVP